MSSKLLLSVCRVFFCKTERGNYFTVIEGWVFIENTETMKKSATVCGSTLFILYPATPLHLVTLLLCFAIYTISVCVVREQHPLIPHHTAVYFRTELWKCRFCCSYGARLLIQEEREEGFLWFQFTTCFPVGQCIHTPDLRDTNS